MKVGVGVGLEEVMVALKIKEMFIALLMAGMYLLKMKGIGMNVNLASKGKIREEIFRGQLGFLREYPLLILEVVMLRKKH